MVRNATLFDVEALHVLGQRLAEESPRYSPAGMYNRDKAEALFKHLVGTLLVPGVGGAFVALEGDSIVGVLLGYVAEHVFSNVKFASDYVFYVAPEARGGTHAADLLRAFEQWAEANGAVEIIPGVSSQINPEGVRKFYTRRGYRHYGYAFVKELNK